MLRLEDPDETIDPLVLRYGQESISEAQGDVDVFPYPGARPDANRLLSLDAIEEIQLSGLMTAWQVADDNDWPDDPLTALARWTHTFENFVNSGQGSGYDLVDEDRDRTIRGFIENATWQRFTGSPYEVEWNLTFHRGGVIDVSRDVLESEVETNDRFIVSSSEVEEKGQDISVELKNPTNYSVSRRQEMRLFPIPQYSLPDYDANEIASISGVLRQITITGEIVGDADARNKFDSDMRSLVGGNQAVVIQTAFPGYKLGGAIEFYDSPREAGQTKLNEYRIRLVQGLMSNETPEPLEPAFFDVTITSTNSPVTEGETLDVSYEVENTGQVTDQQDIELALVETFGAGDVVDTDEDIILQPTNSTTGTLSWQTESGDAGEWRVRVQSDDDAESVEVEVTS